MARLYPINLKVEGMPVLVVGGGAVAFRKVKRLLDAGARVKVVAPSVGPGLAALRRMAPKGALRVVRGKFRAGDAKGARLVFACTGDPKANASIGAAARKSGALVQSATQPEEGDFTLPALVERGEFLLAISTGGASPALSKHLRERLEEIFPESFGRYVELLARVRRKLLAKGGAARENAPRLRALVEGKLEKAVRRGDWKEAGRILETALGREFSLAALGWKKVPK